MPRFTQDQPFDSELNKNTQESLRQNLLSNIENVNPVDGVNMTDAVIPVHPPPSFAII